MDHSSPRSRSSNGSTHLSAHDEWMDEPISFPTESDALLASLALEKNVDPVFVDKFLNLINNPKFNSAECTMRSIYDIHFYASNHRKGQRTENSGHSSKYSTTAPNFVWGQIIIYIGDLWVEHVCKIIEKGEIQDRSDFNDQNLMDLFTASLVHRSWARLAQRQIGRVLILATLDEEICTSAVRSRLFGAWTQILILKTSSMTLSSPLSKSFFARFPSLSTIHFESSVADHTLAFLETLSQPSAVRSLTAINLSESIDRSTNDILSHLSRWPSLWKIYLIGFQMSLIATHPLKHLTMAGKVSQMSEILVSGGKFGACSRRGMVRWIHCHKDSKFQIVGAEIGRAALPTSNADSAVDFKSMDIARCLAWVRTIEELHLSNIHDSEAEYLLGIARNVQILKWTGSSFTPNFSPPAPLQSLHLSVSNISDSVWHGNDRNLHLYILEKLNANPENVTIEVRGSENTLAQFETDEPGRLPDIYFPRSAELCRRRGISLRIILRRIAES